MQRFLSFILATIQALGIPLVAGLFICAVTGEPRRTLEWPFLIDVDYPLLEILLLSLPSILLYAALIRVLKNRRLRAASFVLLAVLAAYFSCVVFAQAFGNTWTQSAIFIALFLGRLHLLAIALLPGLLLWWLIDLLGTLIRGRLPQA
ncbi:MAG: hypothetical protein CUR33_06840 [Pseudomonas sp.]|jgi:cation transport ATPase|uniref:hypothetical protein n=1 Tax=Pseudomonas sp. FEMGT703P TaxID=2080764 RepID=UPI000CC70F52|nr:hypothetical protein [Pseudomonas sp. FEMGT703P]PJE43017.1 MAG: hypothetical protein CUR33_06840 [Pseudomonas sp.] [Pseudomonas sp. FEMGT703P]